MINDALIDHFRDQLESIQHEIQLRLDDSGALNREAPHGDEADRASQEEGQQLQLNRRQHDLSHLKSIRDALRRIDDGEFGFCEKCGDEISQARLQARPESRYCIDCQDLRERNPHAF